MKKSTKIKLFATLILAMTLLLSAAAFVACGTEDKPSDKLNEDGLKEYSITYVGVDGAINPNTVTTYTVDDGEINLQDPKKDGYAFEGWTLNGKPVNKIDGSLKQDITLVANWGAHDCHLELRWSLAEGNRFYYVGEPFLVSFMLLGRNIQVAPDLYLVHGEDMEETFIYWNFMFLSVEGFDSMTAGIKHVTVALRGMPNPNGGTFNASIEYDVEVKEADATRYGYEHIYVNGVEYNGTRVPVEFPNGYTLSAKVKNESWVWAYNWIGTGESQNHAEECSERNYMPWDTLRGTTAFTDTLEVPSIAGFGEVENYRLLTIYDDMTRVYTPVITVGIIEPDNYSDYAFLGEYVFRKGETLDLGALGIGSGKIIFHENGREFTFDNVNYVNDNYKSGGIRSSSGFMYYHTEVGDYAIHLVGENYLTNVYEYQGATGYTINVQGRREDMDSTLLIDGEGSLNIIGGDTAIYAPMIVTVDTILTFASYLERTMTAIDSYALLLTDNAKIYARNVGSGLRASAGGMQIDDGAVVDLRLVAPKPNVFISNYAQMQGLYAENHIIIYSDNFYISATVDSGMYEKFQGVAAVGFIVSAGGNVWIEGADMQMNLYPRSFSADPDTAFDQISGIYAQKTVTITGSTTNGATVIKMNLQADLFNYVQAIGAGEDITIDECAKVDIYGRSVTAFDGIYTDNGKVTIEGGAEVGIVGVRTLLDEDAFGIAASEFEIGKAKLSIEINNGRALAVYIGTENVIAEYDADYVPTKIHGFGEDVHVARFSIMAGAEFYTFETVYDVTDAEHPEVARCFSVDYSD